MAVKMKKVTERKKKEPKLRTFRVMNTVSHGHNIEIFVNIWAVLAAKSGIYKQTDRQK